MSLKLGMPLFASLLLLLGFSCIVLATILVVAFRLPEISFSELLAKGSYIFRNLDCYIAPKMVKPISALIYSGLSILLIVIFGLIIFNGTGS